MKEKLLLPVLAMMLTVVLPTVPAAAVTEPAALTPVTTVSSVKAIDSASTINDPAWFTEAYAAGVRLYVMHSTVWGSCDRWESTESQLRMALAAGLKIAVYTRDPACWQGGISAAGPYKSQLQFFALDVEPGGPVVTQAMVDGVRSMGVRPVIYTGSGIWPSMTKNSTAFAGIPLWDAHADGTDYSGWIANHLSPHPVEYGGWNTAATMRIGVQQKLDQSVNGILVDLSSFDASFLK